jgi:hypothetical protein
MAVKKLRRTGCPDKSFESTEVTENKILGVLCELCGRLKKKLLLRKVTLLP